MMAPRSAAPRLYLVRHGEVEANRTFAFIGRSDHPLTLEGQRQASALGALFGRLAIDRLVSSPLTRCVETARPISETTGCPVVVDPRIIEQAFGDWEGLSRSEIDARGSDDAARFRAWRRDPSGAPPGGEGLIAVQKRTVGLVEELMRSEPRNVVLVSHVSPIKSLICRVLGVPLSQVGRFFLDPASITVIDWRSPPVLRAFNIHSSGDWQRQRWSGSH